MRYVCLISGILMLLAILLGQIGSYLDGRSFTNGPWPYVAVPILLGSLLGFPVPVIITTIRTFKRKYPLRWLAIWIFPGALAAFMAYPLPGFVDGMHERIQEEDSSEAFLKFAEDARKSLSQAEDSLKPHTAKQQYAKLSHRHPAILNLGAYPPIYIGLYEGYVQVGYRNAIANTLWGIRIVDSDEPFEPTQERPSPEKDTQRRALPRVWVFETVY